MERDFRWIDSWAEREVEHRLGQQAGFDFVVDDHRLPQVVKMRMRQLEVVEQAFLGGAFGWFAGGFARGHVTMSSLV